MYNKNDTTTTAVYLWSAHLLRCRVRHGVPTKRRDVCFRPLLGPLLRVWKYATSKEAIFNTSHRSGIQCYQKQPVFYVTFSDEFFYSP